MYNPRSLAGVDFVQIQNCSPVIEDPVVENLEQKSQPQRAIDIGKI